jgi:undecaprenyl-diphosphatase
MPTYLAIALLGLIEGISEFLPVSSTGHLLLAERFLPHQSDLFNTLIQSGTVLAVLLVFTHRLKQLIYAWDAPATRDFVGKLLGAFAVTAVGGLALKKMHLKLPETFEPVAWATLLGGVLFIGVELLLRGRKQVDQISWKVALAMGAGQLIAAVFPGASRSGSTILLALCMGVSRPAATEFSFLLGIPTLLAAGAVQALEAIRSPSAHPDWGMVLWGSTVAVLTAFVAVRWILRYVRHHSFIAFGIYRILLGGGMLLF